MLLLVFNLTACAKKCINMTISFVAFAGPSALRALGDASSCVHADRRRVAAGRPHQLRAHLVQSAPAAVERNRPRDRQRFAHVRARSHPHVRNRLLMHQLHRALRRHGISNKGRFICHHSI